VSVVVDVKSSKFAVEEFESALSGSARFPRGSAESLIRRLLRACANHGNRTTSISRANSRDRDRQHFIIICCRRTAVDGLLHSVLDATPAPSSQTWLRRHAAVSLISSARRQCPIWTVSRIRAAVVACRKILTIRNVEVARARTCHCHCR
jgi:hypothetical protein